MIYKIFKAVFFKFKPEKVHYFFIVFGELLGKFYFCREIISFFCEYKNSALEITVCGIKFQNPVGLGAGFDKNVCLTQIIPEIGFGFAEVGAITYHSSPGNIGLQVVRLPEDESLIVYYGLKNVGAEVVKNKLNKLNFKIPFGINIAKTNNVDVKGNDSIKDYVATYRMLAKYFAYTTINISCPNTQDGCTFQDPLLLNELLDAFLQEKKVAPIFLKISNHLSFREIDDILNVVERYSFVDGFVVGNLCKRREMLVLKSSNKLLSKIPQGGISGRPIKDISTNIIRYIYNKSGERYVIIGLGGIFTAEDAYEKIKAGASLVQIVTGLIYRGPMVVKDINMGLVSLLKKDGYQKISDAVGKESSIV